MLAIRMQRTGRKGHAQFRMVVQNSRTAPSSGRVVAYLGSYDPHTKTARLDTEKVALFLKNGAQPSERAARLMAAEKIALPEWFRAGSEKNKTVRSPEKLRRNRPAEEKAAVVSSEAPAETETVAVEEPAIADEAAEPTTETPAEAEKEDTKNKDDNPEADAKAEASTK